MIIGLIAGHALAAGDKRWDDEPLADVTAHARNRRGLSTGVAVTICGAIILVVLFGMP